jgi:predicted dienelactone hydrolase
MKKSNLLGLVVGLSILCSGLWGLPSAGQENQEKPAAVSIPANPLPPLDGPYPVGTHEYFWIDQKSPELYTSDPADKRHLIVQVWYPAEAVPEAAFAPYITNPREFGDRKEYKSVVHVRTRSVLDAPLAKKERRYPVLIYNHGGGWARFTSSFQTEMLASHGYIVFSVEHTGFSLTTVFPDGYTFINDALKTPEPTGNSRNDALASWKYLEDRPFSIWVRDITFVLDEIRKLNDMPGEIFNGRLDLKKTGSLGWSFGGAASVQAAKDDRRIKAVLDCDGQLFGNVQDAGIDVPVMLMHGETEPPPPDQMDPKVFQELMEKLKETDAKFLAKSRGDRYELKIKGARHGHFSDLVVFYPQSPKDTPARRGHEIINAYSLAFFDRYVKGKGGDLLKQMPSPFPEVDFAKK